ncbi:MAG: hypothetical protein IT440_07700 [Phycisphaeraceae bacterium]|nr:hypothetical protein [Phycisphaeraceae bacterium]
MKTSSSKLAILMGDPHDDLDAQSDKVSLPVAAWVFCGLDAFQGSAEDQQQNGAGCLASSGRMPDSQSPALKSKIKFRHHVLSMSNTASPAFSRPWRTTTPNAVLP